MDSTCLSSTNSSRYCALYVGAWCVFAVWCGIKKAADAIGSLGFAWDCEQSQRGVCILYQLCRAYEEVKKPCLVSNLFYFARAKGERDYLVQEFEICNPSRWVRI